MTKALTEEEKAARRVAREARIEEASEKNSTPNVALPPLQGDEEWVSGVSKAATATPATEDQGDEDRGNAQENAVTAALAQVAEGKAAPPADVDLTPEGLAPAEAKDERPGTTVESKPALAAETTRQAPLASEWLVLREAASYGPVIIDGKAVRCLKGKLYAVPDLNERVAILGTGRFRTATAQDIARSREPSSGPGGAITRDMLPPGALKGGLKR